MNFSENFTEQFLKITRPGIGSVSSFCFFRGLSRGGHSVFRFDSSLVCTEYRTNLVWFNSVFLIWFFGTIIVDLIADLFSKIFKYVRMDSPSGCSKDSVHT